MHAPDLTIEQILAWADRFHKSTGTWPKKDSGRIPGSLGVTWMAVEMALRNGGRGLPSGLTLPRLFAEQRGVRNRMQLPRISRRQILAWAKAHRERTGMWPYDRSGPIPEAPGENWGAVDRALRHGCRGLPGGSSLYRLLKQHARIGVHRRRPPWLIEQILAWADADHARTGEWPTKRSGPIEGVPGTTWMMVQTALASGKRGLPGGFSLGKLLFEYREVIPIRRARLDEKQILKWARDYRHKFGKWPTSNSGKVRNAPRLTWLAVSMALRNGYRGLPGGSSLFRLLQVRR